MRRRIRQSTAGVMGAAVFATLIGTTAPGTAQAQGAPPKEEKVDAKAIGAKIASKDPAKVASGLAEAERAGAAAKDVAPKISKLLTAGTTVALAQKAFAAAASIGESSSSKAIAPYIHHRNQGLRRAAVKALAETGGADAIAAFRKGLRSKDGMVRGYSATGLGNLDAKDSIDDLFLALDHNVTEAAASIGKLCAPADCKKLVTRVQRVAFDVMTSGFDPILFRAEPLDEKDQLHIIGTIRELGTKEAGQYLVDVQSRWPEHYSEKVKQAIDTAITSIPGATEGGDE